VLCLGALLAGCSDGSSGGAAAGGAPASAGSSFGGALGTGGLTTGGANVGGGALGGANAGGASAAGATNGGLNAGGANAGGTNPGGGAPAGGKAGSSNGGGGGLPAGTPTGITVASHDLAVPSGTVFNVADDYFNDGLIPPTPVANFGCQSQITTLANDDGSLDIAWLDYTSGKGKPWAVTSPSMIYLTHVDAALSTATTQASSVSSYKLLGFAKDPAGAAKNIRRKACARNWIAESQGA